MLDFIKNSRILRTGLNSVPVGKKRQIIDQINICIRKLEEINSYLNRTEIPKLVRIWLPSQPQVSSPNLTTHLESQKHKIFQQLLQILEQSFPSNLKKNSGNTISISCNKDRKLTIKITKEGVIVIVSINGNNYIFEDPTIGVKIISQSKLGENIPASKIKYMLF